MKQKYYILAIAILVLAGGFFIFWQAKLGKISLPTLLLNPRGQQTAEKALKFINTNLLPPGTAATLSKISSESSLYKLVLEIGPDKPEVYVSKDGKLLFTQVFNLDELKASPTPSSNQEPPKAEKPNVKVFVMSYCPFGLQMEKAYLPVYELLKDKADFGIYFVNYIMHEKKEIDENLRQYCIQSENKEKFANYLSCFVKNGSAETCIQEAKVDQGKLSDCVAKTDAEFKITALYNDKNTWMSGRYPKFTVHEDLNQEYGVGGSPTVIINSKEAKVSLRSPEAFKNIVCQAFVNPPEKCGQQLSNDVPASGFGEGAGSGSGGSCE
ncbi:MAG: hypothetical protein Q8N16_00885 [bacterium]|nr:hypothetical protein [bacterium]